LTMVGNKDPTTRCDQGLTWPETHDADITEPADGFRVESGSKGLGSVIDDKEGVFLREPTDVIDSGGPPKQMGDKNGPGLCGNQIRDLLRVDVQRLIDVRKNRNATCANNRQYRRETAKGGDDHLISLIQGQST